MGWKVNWYSGLSIGFVFPSTSTTEIVGELMMVGKALVP